MLAHRLRYLDDVVQYGRQKTTLVLDAGGDLGRATNGCGERQRPFFIGVAGGTASGKLTVCQKIVELLGEKDVEHRDRRVYVISQESFYRDLDENDRQLAKKGQFNFDHPAAFNYDLMESTLSNIWKAIPDDILQYDFVNHCRDVTKKKTINTADVILVEGILVFYFEGIRDMFDMKLFVDTDADTRLSRRVVRDIKEYGRPLDQILNQYTTFVKPAFEEFCLPTKKYADVIIPRGADNTVAIDLIVQHIQELLKHEHKHDLNLSAGSASSADSTGCFKLTEDVDLKYTSAH